MAENDISLPTRSGHTIARVTDKMIAHPEELAEWLDEFTKDGRNELVAMNGNLCIFRSVASND